MLGHNERVFSTLVPKLNRVFPVFTTAMKPEAWAPNRSNFTRFVARDQLRVKQVTEIFVLTSRMQAFAWCFVCKVFHTANRWQELRRVRDWLSPFLGLHCTRSWVLGSGPRAKTVRISSDCCVLRAIAL